MTASNTADLCDGIRYLLGGAPNGLREELLHEVFTASTGPLDRDVNQRGSLAETLHAVLRRLRMEGRARYTDDPEEGRRWHAVLTTPPAPLARSLAAVAA